MKMLYRSLFIYEPFRSVIVYTIEKNYETN